MLGANALNSAPLGSDFVHTGGGTITGALTLNIPSGYRSRLDWITLQDFPPGMASSPTMYQDHRAGIYRAYDGAAQPGGGTWVEDAEGIYCGWGHAVIRFEFDGPSKTTLSVTLTGTTFVPSDNHQADAARQTEFSYAATEFSYIYSVPYDPDDDYCYAYLALPLAASYDPDLEVVGQIIVSGFTEGEWTVAEPAWAADPLSSVSPKLKTAEGIVADYNQGGASAVHDSVARTALCDANENNADHGNPVETRTLRFFDYLTGVGEDPADLTFAYSLAAYVTRITNISDAWIASVDSTEFDKAVKDEDDNYLTTMYSFDLCHALTEAVPLVQAIDNACNASIRCSKWTIVAGIKYKIRPDAILGGGLHGPLNRGNALGRSQAGDSVWVRDQGSGDDWVLHETPTSNGAGHWQTFGKVHAAYDPATVLKEYGIGVRSTAVTSTGRWNAREWDLSELVTAVGPTWLLYIAEARILLYFYESDGTIYHIFSNPEADYWQGGTGNAPYTNPREDVAGVSPSAYRDLRHGQIALAYVSGGAVELVMSDDFGENWGAAVSIDLGVNIERSMVWSDEDSGLAHVVAIDESGNVLHAMSSDNFATLLGSVNTVVSGQSDAWPTGYTQRGPGGHGVLYVGFADSDGDYVQYASNDLGSTWEEVA